MDKNGISFFLTATFDSRGTLTSIVILGAISLRASPYLIHFLTITHIFSIVDRAYFVANISRYFCNLSDVKFCNCTLAKSYCLKLSS